MPIKKEKLDAIPHYRKNNANKKKEGETASASPKAGQTLPKAAASTQKSSIFTLPGLEATPSSETAGKTERDDAAIRRSFAQRHPEQTGGELGAANRELGTQKVYLADAEKKQEEAKAEREAAQAAVRQAMGIGTTTATVPNYQKLGQLQRTAKDAEGRYEAAKRQVMDTKDAVTRAEAQVETAKLPYDVEDLNQALAAARTERDAAEAEMEAAQEELGRYQFIEHDSQDPDFQSAGARYDAAAVRKEQAELTLTQLVQRQYTRRNEDAFSRLGGDAGAAQGYLSAQAAEAEMERVTAVVDYYRDGTGDADAIAQTMEALQRSYGVTATDFVAYANAQEGWETGAVKALYDKLNAQIDQQAEEMKAGGYDYQDMQAYLRRAQAQQKAAQEAQKQAEFAKEHPVAAATGSVLAVPFQALDVFGVDWGKGKQGDLDYIPPDTSGMRVSNAVNTIRGTQARELEIGTDAELFGQNVASFLYQTGMSMADSALSVAALGPGSVYLMGTNAAVNGAKDIIERGGTREQAIAGGLAAGVAETLFEKVSIDQLLTPKDITGWKSFLKETLKQGGVELSEETFTEMANIFSDTAIMGANSNSARAQAAYEAQGMTQEEARRQVFLDNVAQVVWAGAGGFVSGVGMGGGKAALDYAGEALTQRSQNTATLEARTRVLEQGIAELNRQQVARDAEGLGTQGRATVAAMYLEDQDPDAYTQGMRALYEAGVAGAAMDSVESEAAQGLNDHQRRAAYKAGTLDRVANSQTSGNLEAGEGVKGRETSQGRQIDTQRMGTAGRAGLKAAMENRRAAGQTDAEIGAMAEGYMDFYLAGLNGAELGEDGAPTAAGPNARGLLETEKRFAYENGRQDAVAAVAENKRRASFATVAGTEKGLVMDDYVARSLPRKEADRMNRLAKRLNVRVVFVDSVLGGSANGQIVEADIRIAKDADQPAMVVFGHEVGHYLEKMAPEEYQALRRFTAQHRQEEIDGLLELYSRKGLEKSYDDILKELVNDDIGRMIADAQTLNKFIEENKRNRPMLRKVADALRALWQRLTGKDREQVKSAEEALLAALKASEAQADKLEAAGQVMRKADTRAEYNLKGQQFEEDKYFSRQMDRWDELPDGSRVKVGLIQKGSILNQVGLPDAGMYFDVGKIKGAMGRHSDHLTAETLKGIPNLLNDPIVIVEYTGSRGDIKNTVNVYGNLFENGHPVVVGVVMRLDRSGKALVTNIRTVHARSNFAKQITDESVLYLNENKKRTRTWFQVCGNLNVPLEGTRYGLIRSIAFDAEEVKGEFSLKGSEMLTQEVAQVTEQGRQEGWSAERMQEETREAVRRTLESLLEEYGAIKPGENPAREIQVPKKTEKEKRVSQTVRTILEAGATPEEAIPTIEELTVAGDFSYEVISDKAAIKRAEETIKYKGWGGSLADWFEAVKKGVVSKDNTALGWALYNQAANSGDIQTAMDILQSMVRHQRNAAQAVQGSHILKKLSPETQLYAVQRSVESLQEELNERYGGSKKGKAPKLTIDEDLARRLLETKDQNERDEVLQDIYRDVGRQLPSTLLDKWNAWRYLSMLANPRTHVRNIVGNAGFTPVVLAKDAVATAIERAVYAVSGGKLERSKGFVGLGQKGRGLLTAAWGDYAKVEEAAMGGGKYSEFQQANRYVEEGRVVFKSKPGKVLETARKANSKALDAEDVWFSRPHYAYAMAQYCVANGITEEMIREGSGAALEKAREYAIREAQKATYRDTNALSQLLGGLGSNLRRSGNAVGRGSGMVVEGVLPFRKTPANILARGLEYSPLGLMKSLTYDLAQVRQGNLTGAEVIDHISAGLTGTGLMALGVFLAAQGVLRGKGPGDEKERELARLQGHQDYSMEVGGVSITLDWLAPEVLPLFVGVNLWELMQKEGDLNMSDALMAVSYVSDPLLEMSCLQSLNDIFDSVGYASENEMNPLVSALVSGATSYITQGLPTIFGQLERTLETQRETTFVSKNDFLTGDMQYFLGKASGKVPGWEFQQIPYIDAWGRIESTGGIGERAFQNFLDPAYVSTIESSPMEKELERLYDATGEGGVFPSRAKNYINVNGERHDLTAEEYVKYATQKGQTAHEVAEALVRSKGYSGLEEGEKAEAVKDAYQYAEQVARKATVKEYSPDSWVTKAQDAEKKYGIPVETYILLRQRTAGVESIKDKEGKPISNSAGLQIMAAVYDTPGLGDRQRQYLFEALGAGKSILSYNKLKVQEKLEEIQAAK